LHLPLALGSLPGTGRERSDEPTEAGACEAGGGVSSAFGGSAAALPT
jgi:hypothetical protein